VATSTLELGTDVGDLDRVIQIDAPPKVAPAAPGLTGA
jgi:ATP-dependent Lhr-like helicase